MSDHEPRLWPHDEAIRRGGEGFLACTLPKPQWTHQGHIPTTRWRVLPRARTHLPQPRPARGLPPAPPPNTRPDRALPPLIRRYNESVGGVNSDTEGYHETITQVFLHGVRLFLSEVDPKEPLHDLVNEL